MEQLEVTKHGQEAPSTGDEDPKWSAAGGASGPVGEFASGPVGKFPEVSARLAVVGFSVLAALALAVVLIGRPTLSAVPGPAELQAAITQGDSAEVPDVTGLSVADARAMLESANLKLGPIAELASTDRTQWGTVVTSTPSEGMSIPEGWRVSLAVAFPAGGADVIDESAGEEAGAGAGSGSGLGSRTPPPANAGLIDVTGLTAAQAAALLTAYTVRVRVVPSPDELSAGLVLATQPAAGAKLNAGAIVTLSVAASPTSELDVAVPNLTGMTRVEAFAAVLIAGLQPQVIISPGAGQVDQVIAQRPEPGGTLPPGGRVQVTVRGAASNQTPNPSPSAPTEEPTTPAPEQESPTEEAPDGS
jgi:beta-lactam-binding protein with PASTA domain